MAGRRFYRTRFIVEVLSEGRYTPASVEQISDDAADFNCVAGLALDGEVELNAEEVVAALGRMGADPDFFSL
ncbi:MAG TPA: hypothetical protein VF265_03935 [Nevskiaceae bacterium]